MTIFAKAALAAAAASLAVAGLAAPTLASAQPYGYADRDGYYYDPCKRDTVQRGTTGALAGGALGAVVGSNIASGGQRTEGAVLGGLLGAAIGAGVGKNSAACAPGEALPPPPPPPQAAYGHERYGADYSYEYEPRPYGYGYDEPGPAYPRTVAGGEAGADGCTLAESPIYLPDGTVQKRFVRVCRDSSGRYQVVD